MKKIPEGMKKCSKCGEVKAFDEFYCDNQRKDGRHPVCTGCQKKWREENKEYFKKYHEDNKEKLSKYFKKYRKENIEGLSEYQKKYYKDNKQKIMERRKKYREENREKLRRLLK